MAQSLNAVCINGIHLVLCDMQNRTFGPYLAAMHRIHIPVVEEALEGPQSVTMQPWFLQAHRQTFHGQP
jgi:hypothetical protein